MKINLSEVILGGERLLLIRFELEKELIFTEFKLVDDTAKLLLLGKVVLLSLFFSNIDLFFRFSIYN